MALGFAFFLNSILFGVGLAMDAFSVSVANAIADPGMKARERLRIAGCFALFQILMPLLGWLCVRTIAESFTAFQKFIPWIALGLLLYIGGKMLLEGIRGGEEGEETEEKTLGHGALLLQGVATSIDALSVGFTIEEYPFPAALTEALIIGAVTLAICLGGLFLGRKIGEKLSRIAPILGGVILIGIGVEIFLTGIF
jgi:putative Mn2+ efflux pump MntP